MWALLLLFISVLSESKWQPHLALAGKDVNGLSTDITVSWFTLEKSESTVFFDIDSPLRPTSNGVATNFHDMTILTPHLSHTDGQTRSFPYQQYGPHQNLSLQREANGTSTQYLPGYGYHHHVVLSNLQPSTKYVYRFNIDSSNNLSPLFSFTSPSNSLQEEFNIAIFGDMGWLDSTKRPMKIVCCGLFQNWTAVPSKNMLTKWSNENAIDLVWHVGDIGYMDNSFVHKHDFWDKNGPIHVIAGGLLGFAIGSLISSKHSASRMIGFLSGSILGGILGYFSIFEYERAYNGYMTWMSELTSKIPYHVSPGNHESECHSPACFLRPELGRKLSNFTAYNHRWRMPSNESNGNSNMWYSFRYGSAHFISLNTETNFVEAQERHHCDSGFHVCGGFSDDYLAWVEKDLKMASLDPKVKWIIAGGHREYDELFDHVPLFDRYGVDLYFAGHLHSYLRTFPIKFGIEQTQGQNGYYLKPNGTIYIVSGGAGNDEMEQSENSHRNLADVTYKTVHKTSRYSMGKLSVTPTKLHWKLYDSVTSELLDQVIVSKNEQHEFVGAKEVQFLNPTHETSTS